MVISEKIRELAKKYRYVLLVLLAGILLMLLPTRGKTQTKAETDSGGYSLADTEKRMAEVLQEIEGVGRVKVMLTLKSGSTLQLAEDNSSTQRDTELRRDSEVVTLNRGSGQQEVVVTRETYPVYQGAVVVCEGADNAAVCLRVTEAVAVLTGLSSDKISVVKWKT